MQTSEEVSSPFNRVALFLASLTILTSSFDIFLAVQVGGTYRLCQIAAAFLFVIAVLKVRRSGVIPVLGAVPLIIWSMFQVFFMSVSAFWPKSLAYCVWLTLNLGMMFSFVQLFGSNPRLLSIVLRFYAVSFALVGMFGVFQVVLPLIGLPAPLVEQWWIAGRLARANGFSYEPSYFATYLLLGVVFTGSLRRAPSSVLSNRKLVVIYWICVAGIVASSSRMGIVMLLLDFVLQGASPWLTFIRQLFQRRIVFKTARALIPSLALLGVFSLLTLQTIRFLESDPLIALMFLNGTGLSNTAAHSVIQREGALDDTLEVFMEHPVIGQSLGGVSIAIAGLHGESITSFEASKEFEGMNVFAEALAASGVVGIIPFVAFLCATIWRPLKQATLSNPFYRDLLRSLVRSLLFGWMALQFNQNMLRPYLWVHIALLACVYNAARLNAPAEAARTSQA